MHSTRALTLSLLVAASAPSAAWAEATPPVSLGEGFELVSVSSLGSPKLYVRKGTLRTRFGAASSVGAVHIDASARSVLFELEDWCNRSYQETWTYGALEARLENTNAYQLHLKKNYKAAAPGFARAAALDPTWNIPAYNLASAQTLLGDQDAAVKALAPWLASAPIATYLQVTTDPELAPLLARPELKAIHAKQPGTVTLTADGITGQVALTADRTLLAVVHPNQSWGSSSFSSQLEIYETATGKFVAGTPFIAWNDTSFDCYPESPTSKDCSLTPAGRATATRRAATLQVLLRALGFVQAVIEPATLLERDGRWGKKRFSFPKHKLGIVEMGGNVRVLQQNTELASSGIGGGMDTAVLVDSPRLVVVWSSSQGSEGCGSSDPSYVNLIPLKTP